MPRLGYSNEIYHIIARGDGRRKLFHVSGHYDRTTDCDGDIRAFVPDALGRRAVRARSEYKSRRPALGRVVTETMVGTLTNNADHVTSDLVQHRNAAGASVFQSTVPAVYNRGGQMTSRSLAAGNTGSTPNILNNQLTSDPLNRVTRVAQSGGTGQTKAADFVYDSAGRLDLVKLYNSNVSGAVAITTDYTCNNRDQLRSLQHFAGVVGSSVLAGYVFAYDVRQRLSSMNQNADGPITYASDVKDQLTGVDYTSGTLTDSFYTLDFNGNRTSDGAVYGSDNRLTSVGGATYVYDKEGHLLSRTVSTQANRGRRVHGLRLRRQPRRTGRCC